MGFKVNEEKRGMKEMKVGVNEMERLYELGWDSGIITSATVVMLFVRLVYV